MEENKKIKKNNKDAVDIQIVKKRKKGKIFSLDDVITGYDDQIGLGFKEINMLTEEEANEKNKLTADLNMSNGRDVVIAYRRLAKKDNYLYVKGLEDQIIALCDINRGLIGLFDITIMYKNMFDLLPDKIRLLAEEEQGIDWKTISKKILKDCKKELKPKSREELLAERPTPEHIRKMKILHFEGSCPDIVKEEWKKCENMTDDEYVAYRNQEREDAKKFLREWQDEEFLKGCD